MYSQRWGSNKYGAKRTEFNGRKFDSKFEAGVAQELDLRLKAKDIKAVEPQYKVIMPVYRSDGTVGFTVNHKVDFRVTNNDGSYTLVEAKGYATEDWKWRRKILENLWLPEHLDYTYEVVKQRSYYR